MTRQDKDTRAPSRDEWLDQRRALLAKEKTLMREADELRAQVRALPPIEVQDYAFTGSAGAVKLSDLFAGRSQLVIYHFMFGLEAETGCPSCSLITDSIDPTLPHLGARDVSLALVSRGPIERLLAYRKRMGWSVPWVSSQGSSFNPDFQASTDDVGDDGKYLYNFELMDRYPTGEQPGLSVFRRGDDGKIFHTYSAYARGLESFMPAYTLLDHVPKGRDEAGLPWGMAWVRRHDEYES
ncbi:MAG: DUF899 domain-containing protein [Nannocystaceae bacterium]|nr:DUF899 domain-containing protein [Nannocystaceae bacterium]